MCDQHLSRRAFLGGTAAGFFGYAMAHGMPLFGQEGKRAKRCVILWMNGGPSQMDTFDLKPGTKTGGSFREIDTNVKGLRISQHLPRIAKHMDKLSVIRTLQTKVGDHGRANYLLHTGFPLEGGFARPSIGSVISRESKPEKFPKYVTIGSEGFGPAYMGAEHAPFSVNNAQEALRIFRRIENRQDRIRLMREIGADFEKNHECSVLEERQAVLKKIEELVDTDFVKALDTSNERHRYGRTPFAERCLIARRMLEVGVPFVEVGLDGWDTHNNNFRQVQRLSSQLDAPWAAMMDDLKAGGLLEETIVLWMGEFGRTPDINAGSGRDHWPNSCVAVIGGGGIPGGRVIGETDALGRKITKDPVSVPDLLATMFDAFGIQPDKKYRNSFGALAPATDAGVPIKGLR